MLHPEIYAPFERRRSNEVAVVNGLYERGSSSFKLELLPYFSFWPHRPYLDRSTITYQALFIQDQRHNHELLYATSSHLDPNHQPQLIYRDDISSKSPPDSKNRLQRNLPSIPRPRPKTHAQSDCRKRTHPRTYSYLEYTFFTGPPHTSPTSINSIEDAWKSTEACLPLLKHLLSTTKEERFDGVLVACYSPHPLVDELRTWLVTGCDDDDDDGGRRTRRMYVMGIFEASVTTALNLLVGTTTALSFSPSSDDDDDDDDDEVQGKKRKRRKGRKVFGIVSTGKVWEEVLTTAILDLLGIDDDDHDEDDDGRGEAGKVARRNRGSNRFAGVQTTGLTASQLHTIDPAEVARRMKEATKRLLLSSSSVSSSSTGDKHGHVVRSEVGVICLGCAGMVGMESVVREACIDVLGPEAARRICVVDGVLAGVGVLEGLIRGGF